MGMRTRNRQVIEVRPQHSRRSPGTVNSRIREVGPSSSVKAVETPPQRMRVIVLEDAPRGVQRAVELALPAQIR